MEKLKGKYEIILGFVTLVLSFSAFKEELSKININIGLLSFSLSQYFLFSVIGFAICLYLYIIEQIIRDTKIGSWKIFDFIIFFAFLIFTFILLSPIVILFSFVAFKIYNFLTQSTEEETANLFLIFLQLIWGLVIIFSFLASNKYIQFLKNKLADKFSNQEILELESANKLYESGYYSNSVLESFKVLASHLSKKISEKNFRVPIKLNEVVALSLKFNIISQEDVEIINKLKEMRNNVAHNPNIMYTKEEATFTLNFVKNLIKS